MEDSSSPRDFSAMSARETAAVDIAKCGSRGSFALSFALTCLGLGPTISYGHTFSRGLKRANIKASLKNDTWSEQRDSNCQSEVQVSGSECQMVAHSDCSKMGILCAGRGAQTQILIRWIVNAETLIAIFIDHPPLLASCCGNSEA